MLPVFKHAGLSYSQELDTLAGGAPWKRVNDKKKRVSIESAREAGPGRKEAARKHLHTQNYSIIHREWTGDIEL